VTIFAYVGGSIGSPINDLGEAAIRLPLPPLTERAEALDAAMSGLVVDDDAGSLDVPGLRAFAVNETDCSVKRLYSGYVTNRHILRGDDKRQSLRISGKRQWDVDLVDYNMTLSRRVIRGSDGNRPAETDVERAQWIIASDYTPTVTDAGLIQTSGPVDMDPVDYRGRYPTDVLADCGNASGKNYFVYFDEPTNHPAFAYFFGTSTLYSSTLRLSNVASDIDSSTTFAATCELYRDPSRVFSGVYLKYDGGSVFRSNSTTEAAFQRVEVSIDEPDIKSRTKAIALADKYLTDGSAEDETLTITLQLPSTHVNLVQPGQRIQVKFSHIPGYTSFTYTRVVSRTVSQAADTDKVYDVVLECKNPKLIGRLGSGSGPVSAGTGNNNVPPPSPTDNQTGLRFTISPHLTAFAFGDASKHANFVLAYTNSMTGTPVWIMSGDSPYTAQASFSADSTAGDTTGLVIHSSNKVVIGDGTSGIDVPMNTPLYLVARYTDGRRRDVVHERRHDGRLLGPDRDVDRTTGRPLDRHHGGHGQLGRLGQRLHAVLVHRHRRQRGQRARLRPAGDARADRGRRLDDDLHDQLPLRRGHPPGLRRRRARHALVGHRRDGLLHPAADRARRHEHRRLLLRHGRHGDRRHEHDDPDGRADPRPDLDARLGHGQRDDLPARRPDVGRAVGRQLVVRLELQQRRLGQRARRLVVERARRPRPPGRPPADLERLQRPVRERQRGGGLGHRPRRGGPDGHDHEHRHEQRWRRDGHPDDDRGGRRQPDRQRRHQARLPQRHPLDRRHVATYTPAAAGGGDFDVSPNPTADDDEFKATDTSAPMTGWTTLGTVTAQDTNSTVLSHLYLKRAALSTLAIDGIYKAIPSIPFTVTAKLTAHTARADFGRVGIFYAEATPGQMETLAVVRSSGDEAGNVLDMASPTSLTGTVTSTKISTSNLSDRSGRDTYFRFVIASATDVSYLVSYDGLLWFALVSNRNPGFTIGSVGLFVSPFNASNDVEALFDWIRFGTDVIRPDAYYLQNQ
jgi:hypothetical protein